MQKTEIKNEINKQKVEFIQLQFINILGEVHSVEMPISEIDIILDNKVMIDGSSIKGYTTLDNSDLFLKPDLDTFLVLHFLDSEIKVARMICDILNKDGSIFEGAPRQILRSVEEKYAKDNFSLFAGLEAEFFFLKKDAEGKYHPIDNSGYFDATPLDVASNLKREISKQLIKHNFTIEALHTEVSAGQQEINFKYDTALKTADRIITFKWIVKTIAQRHGYIATFMPKPFAAMNGSGLHTNMSIFKNNKNLFCNDKKELSKEMMYFISGIIKKTREISLLTNPTINSYKRLIPGFEAPNCIAWSDSNRSAMIRVPAARGKGTRVEVRCVDATSNPYIMLAILFSAGIEGIKNKETYIEPVYENLFKLTMKDLHKKGIELLPLSLGDSIQLFKHSKLSQEILGKDTFNKYLMLKQKEWDEYRQIVHQWEIEKYIKY